MKLLLVLLSLLPSCLANNQEVGIALFSDIHANIYEYYSVVMEGSIDIPKFILTYYQDVKTYTDDSYTTLFSDFPVNSGLLSAFSELPWYSSRLESAISVALTENGPIQTFTNTSSREKTVENVLNSTFSLTASITSFSLHPPTQAYNSSVVLSTQSSDSSVINTIASSNEGIANSGYLVNFGILGALACILAL